MSELEVGLRRLRSTHPRVLVAMQLLYRANPDNRAAVDAIVTAAAQASYDVHRSQTLALRCMYQRAGTTYQSMRYPPDVALDYLLAIAGVKRETNATPEFRQALKRQADTAPQLPGVDPSIDITPGACGAGDA